MPERTRRRMRAGLALLGCAMSAALLALLFRSLPFDAAAWRASLAEVRWAGLAGILGTTLLHCAITALKWRLVTRVTARGADLGLGFYAYTALIGLLGQVLPMHVALLAGRSVALRGHARVPLRRGAGGVLYDQAFDLLVPALMLVPLLLVLGAAVSLRTGTLIAVLLALAAGVALATLGEPVIRAVLGPLVGRLPARWRESAALRSLQQDRPALASRVTLATLYGYSLLRFSNLVLRAWLVAWTLNLNISWMVILFANGAVTLSLILAFVPGGLGVVEWGWVGMLLAFGVPAEAAAHYAISSRLFALAALAIVNLANLLIAAGYWAWRSAAPHGEKGRVP